MKPIDNIDRLDRDEQIELAFSKMMRSVSIREQSSIKIKRKLYECGFSEDVIGEVLERAYRISAIDDRRYCECLIRSALSAGRGLRDIAKEVESLDIEIESLESYQSYLEEGEDVQIEKCLTILKNHPPRSKNILNSSFNKLIAKGYSYSIASKASKIFCDGNY